MVRWISARSRPLLPETLPSLRGWALTIYTVAWSALLVVAIAVTKPF